ncbi:MAG: EAL domain-containing protein [Cellulosilyticum sp.]|nr:EAL domain-containing protein [Cellulosilyticum sp.]
MAEGIENEEQLYIVSALGCEMGQGYFWGRPLDSKTITKKYFQDY